MLFSYLIRSVIAICVAGSAICAFGLGLGVDMDLATTNISEPVSVNANFKNWRTPHFDAGEKTYSKSIARAGMHSASWRLGYTQQQYYYLNYSADTARLHYLNKNNQLKSSKALLELSLQANNALAEGAYVSFRRDWGTINAELTITHLSLSQLMYGEASGLFDPSDSLSNQSSIELDYAYYEDTLFERQVTPPKGTGITLDLAVQWQYQNHALEVLTQELYSRFIWSRAPSSLVTGKLNLLQRDGESSLKYQHFNARIDQRLPVHTQIRYSYKMTPHFSIGGMYESLDQLQWHKMSVGWLFARSSELRLLHDPAESLWGVEIQSPWAKFKLESDSLDEDSAHVLNIALSVRMSF